MSTAEGTAPPTLGVLGGGQIEHYLTVGRVFAQKRTQVIDRAGLATANIQYQARNIFQVLGDAGEIHASLETVTRF